MSRTSDGTSVLVPVVVSREGRRHDDYRVALGGWLSQYGPRTRHHYRQQLERWEAWCSSAGVLPLDAARADIQSYGIHLEQRGLMASTRAHYICTLQSFYGYCHEEEILDRNPAARVKRPKFDNDAVRPYMTRPEAAKFLATAASMRPKYRLRDHALACVLVLNGLRVSEVCDLNIETMAQQRGHQTIVVAGKGGRIDTAVLGPPTFWAITAYIAGRNEGPIFLGADGRRLTTSVAAYRVRAIAKAAGLGDKHLSPHAMRRTFITGALDAKVELSEVQAAARHADPRTTARYDQGRKSLDHHPTYVVGAFFSGG